MHWSIVIRKRITTSAALFWVLLGGPEGLLSGYGVTRTFEYFVSITEGSHPREPQIQRQIELARHL